MGKKLTRIKKGKKTNWRKENKVVHYEFVHDIFVASKPPKIRMW